MSGLSTNLNGQTTLDIIAFQLGAQTFCIETTSVREIRGWGASTPLPHTPAEVLGVINLRGTAIPTIDLARKLGMRPCETTERSAIVVVEVHDRPSAASPVTGRRRFFWPRPIIKEQSMEDTATGNQPDLFDAWLDFRPATGETTNNGCN
ncbi:chemotaxis protein CheW [Rhizobium sp. Rhizsp82]|uniref:chemotaxis protein CheW n=1 Tax=Rhizobium sp. Rhizsp82 TaxID=3243057 RepID=UPI0039B41A4E